MKTNIIDLFAGAGGLSEGFHRVGFNPVAYIEKDKNACDTLLTRHIYWQLKRQGKLSIYFDYINNKITKEQFLSYLEGENPVINEEISTLTLANIIGQIEDKMKKSNIQSIDIFVGGPPCQAYSLVGRARDKYGMKKDPRNLLYKFYIELLIHFHPKLFVFENVPGILSAAKGKLWEDVKRDFGEAGYHIDYKILDATKFGVLQKRKRVVLIGWQKSYSFQYPDFSENTLEGTIKGLFEDLPKLRAGESINIGEYISLPNKYLITAKIRNKEDVLFDHISRPINDHDKKIYRKVIDAWNESKNRLSYSDLPNELKTHSNQLSFLDRFKVVANNMPYSHTVVAHISKDGHYYIHPDIQQLRSISVREAARIQSFPDDYKFEGSRTSKFMQIGNAVPPLMAEKIAKEIKKLYE